MQGETSNVCLDLLVEASQSTTNGSSSGLAPEIRILAFALLILVVAVLDMVELWTSGWCRTRPSITFICGQDNLLTEIYHDFLLPLIVFFATWLVHLEFVRLGCFKTEQKVRHGHRSLT